MQVMAVRSIWKRSFGEVLHVFAVAGNLGHKLLVGIQKLAPSATAGGIAHRHLHLDRGCRLRSHDGIGEEDEADESVAEVLPLHERRHLGDFPSDRRLTKR